MAGSFRKLFFLCLHSLIAILLVGCTVTKQNEKTDSSIINKVNPFIGTAPLLDPAIIGYTPPKDWRVWAGLVFPGSSLPNAMVQLSPMTQYGSGAGYEYEHTEILSFTHTNKGHWNLCNVPVLPVSGKASAPFKSSFSHDREEAKPAYYSVYLADYGINVRLSSTLRAGIHEYTYEQANNKKVLFDLGKANNRVRNWEIQQVGNAVKGFQDMGGETVYFYAEFDTPISSLDLKSPGAEEGYALLDFHENGSEKMVMKIGISYVSSENAAENLKAEIGNKDIEAIIKAGQQQWHELLSMVEVQGGTEKQQTLFYTSLYRSFLWPALRSDVNGEFRDEKKAVQKKDFNYYTIPSLWDTYRNKDILLGLLQPQVSNDVIKSLINRGQVSGYIPTFFHGDHGAAYIAGTYFRDIGDFDVKEAYSILLKNAYDPKGPRQYLQEYMDKGFISDPDVQNPHVETKGRAGVSKTLEYAYDDYSLSLLAEALGDPSRAEELKARSQNYKNVFDKQSLFMRGKLSDGSWIEPFNPEYPYYEYMYREGNAWQLSFYVPHDMQGLVKLYGGAKPFEDKLDAFFTKPWNPNYIARNISGFLGQYSHGNQPGHEAPFSYYFIGKPEKSQAVIDKLLNEYYGVGEHELALVGMDDAGEMSAWYVFNALGFYPFSPADANYLLTVPIFDKIQLRFPGYSPLEIVNPKKGRNLKGVTLNGKPVSGYFLSHDLFRKGGVLEYNAE